MMTYKTLSAEKPELLDNLINIRLRAGWKLHGEQYAIRDADKRTTMFYQAMTLTHKKTTVRKMPTTPVPK